eukprot:5024727-Amphidinium_carterae.1
MAIASTDGSNDVDIVYFAVDFFPRPSHNEGVQLGAAHASPWSLRHMPDLACNASPTYPSACGNKRHTQYTAQAASLQPQPKLHS